MSYDIQLENIKTGEVARMRHVQYVRGGTVPAEINPITGQPEQAQQAVASINITYNYSHYYDEATEGDPRFAHGEISARYQDGTAGPIETEYGIRGLYGKTAAESIPMLIDMVNRIKSRYTDENGMWLPSECAASEGDTSCYWKATATNAIRPLLDMIVMATDNLTENDAVWNGD